MKPRELEQYMRDNGFIPKRRTATGTLWYDGRAYVNVAQRYTSPTAQKNLEADVKRIVRNRAADAIQGEPKVDTPKAITPKPVSLTHRMAIEPLPNGHAKEPLISLAHPERQQGPRKPSKTCRRFTAAKQHMIYREIYRMNLQGKDSVTIAVALHDSGERMSDGSPFEAAYINSALHNMEHPYWAERRESWRKEFSAPQPASVAPAPVQQPVAPAPVQATKSARQIPSWMAAFLTDPELTAQEKIEMILAVGRL